MHARLLLLADSRLPAGGHAHSGTLEPATAAGAVHDVPSLAAFLIGRLHTTGLVTAVLAAAAAHRAGTRPVGWMALHLEAEARTPSPAQRSASVAQGRSLLRAAHTTWPHPAIEALRAEIPAGPHHPLALGAATTAAGGTPPEAASIAAYLAVTGPASAAVRLLGLDPLAVHRALADLAPRVDAVAAQAGEHAEADWADLPAASAPALDLLAETHLEADLRLFES